MCLLDPAPTRSPRRLATNLSFRYSLWLTKNCWDNLHFTAEIPPQLTVGALFRWDLPFSVSALESRWTNFEFKVGDWTEVNLSQRFGFATTRRWSIDVRNPQVQGQVQSNSDI